MKFVCSGCAVEVRESRAEVKALRVSEFGLRFVRSILERQRACNATKITA